ncbi:MAG: hypothetical protein M3O15_13660 [Acidobacteriota bacterium]|nr:hypothetical protein [Acidobacteriota bacterium]
MRIRTSLAAVTVLLLAVSTGASAAQAPQKIIALQVRALGANGAVLGTYGVEQENVPVNVGDSVRLNLVGTAIINGTGNEVPVNAHFSVNAGRGNVSLGRSGPNWVIVNVTGGGGNGLAQVAYATSGNYDMRGGLKTGFITLQIGGGQAAPPPSAGSTQGRADKAQQLATMLHAGILRSQLGNGEARADVDRIYQDGNRGVRTVALALARQAENLGLGASRLPRGYQDQDLARVGELYQSLLGRTDDPSIMYQRDRGFQDNVHALHTKGLVAVVQSIVDSAEFASVNQLDGF